MIRESGDLLKCGKCLFAPDYGGMGAFALQEIGCGSQYWLPQFFVEGAVPAEWFLVCCFLH